METAIKSKVAALDPMAVSVSWQSGLMHRPYKLRNGVNGTVRGFESRTHRQNNSAPTKARTSIGAEIRTAEAVQTFQLQYRAFGCESQGDSSHDVPQLPN